MSKNLVFEGGSAVVEETAARLAGPLGPDRAARWTVPRNHYAPTLRMETDDQGPVAAVLTSARPATAATKIVDLWWRDGAADVAGGLLDEVMAAASARGDAAVKWELPLGGGLPGFGVERGFAPMRAPWSAKGTERIGGAVAWLEEIPHRELGFFAQTTMFTCGSVAALMAMDVRGHVGLTGDSEDRAVELSFWRQAANFPACEPVGLGVAMAEALAPRGVAVEIVSDVDGPVLIEDFDGFEREFREELQAESVRQAHQRGVGLSRAHLSMSRIVDRIAAGEIALLLIDEAPMHGDPGPHWITAHAARGDLVLVQDPWVGVNEGETWVDTHDLPIRASSLDEMVAWGENRLRGVVFVASAATSAE